MKKLIISLLSLIVSMSIQATSLEEIREKANITEATKDVILSTSFQDEALAEGYSEIYVLKPSTLSGGTLTIRNNSTGQQYSLGNGSNNPSNNPQKYTIPNGTYTVTSIETGSCNGKVVTMSNGQELVVGSTITYSGSGYVSFDCR